MVYGELNNLEVKTFTYYTQYSDMHSARQC